MDKYIILIKAIYESFEIELGKSLSYSKNKAKQSKSLKYKDLPTYDEIRKTLKITNQVMIALILFMTSSGCGKAESLSFTKTKELKERVSRIEEMVTQDNFKILNEMKKQ